MKKSNRRIVAVVAGVLTLVTVGAGAAAPQFRESVMVKGTVASITGDHLLTFSGPVALPGVALAAGTYTFRRPAGNVLQVSNAKGQPYALLMTRPVNRSGRTDGYEIVLGAPLADGAPRRIEAWFTPGDSTGQELIYPR